jgi:hypothetical protein
MDGLIEFRGTYRYQDIATLEHALADARERLAEDDDAGLDWADCFIRRGAQLWVRARLSLFSDRFTAAALMQTLAGRAVEGYVEDATVAVRSITSSPARR